MEVLLLTVMVLCAGWVGFAYVGYPVALLVLNRLSPRPIRAADHAPSLAVIIAVHNGEKELPEKLRNTLGCDYPGDLEVIVASDNSTDRTDAIAEGVDDERVRLIRNSGPRGKESAQARAIEAARSEILVFTDVSAQLAPDALRAIVRPFADATVGSVSSEDDVDSNGGEGAYVRYEMALRRMENDCSSLIGLSGSFFAVRRELADPWPTDLASDFRTALESCRRGYRAVSAQDAKASFRAVEDAAAEWPRKVRTVRRGIAVLSAYRDLLHPRHGRVAFSLWGHKVSRFTSPFALILLLAANVGLAAYGALGMVLLAAQVAFYGIGLAGLASRSIQGLLVPRLAAFFILVNASMVVAWRYHLSGERSVQWQPTER